MQALGFVLFIVYGIAQIVAAYVGIDFHLGAGWAIGAMVAAFLFRFTLPITVGSFFGAMDVWNWHWVLAGLFAAPGLAFVIPGVLMAVVEGGKK